MYFACGAQQTLFQYNSRIGHMPAYNTTLATLKELAQTDAQFVLDLGRDPNRGLSLRSDNIQQYVVRREARIGRASTMKIGMSAIVTEIIDYDPVVFSVEDKLRRLKETKRGELTVSQLLDMIDIGHARRVGTIQWLQVLVTYIPQLASMKPKVAELYRTDGAHTPAPRRNHRTTVYPLGTVAKNENVTTEFRDALLDFLEQGGQTPGDSQRRIIPCGGDGLTFERTVQIKMLMRFHDDPVKTFHILDPFLETWHTGATHLNSCYETHWGETLTSDVSKLGHNANKIGRQGPSNLKKVDYYPGIDLIYLVLDVRMLDCWR